ncbi:hypothetical protein AVEN_255042-1 [Araneus ventricosus]|uniref:Uncharacterized protein n=1 Tax=Araneus ventricosus TaxID=182803 RepID=A0A4Y2T6J8_ARAVE|nr:hypothetical protein AVEN_255042-1 [Araneus ventricosus]
MLNSIKSSIKTAQYVPLHVQQCVLIAEPYFPQLNLASLPEYQEHGAECCPSDVAEMLASYGIYCPSETSRETNRTNRTRETNRTNRTRETNRTNRTRETNRTHSRAL